MEIIKFSCGNSRNSISIMDTVVFAWFSYLCEPGEIRSAIRFDYKSWGIRFEADFEFRVESLAFNLKPILKRRAKRRSLKDH